MNIQFVFKKQVTITFYFEIDASLQLTVAFVHSSQLDDVFMETLQLSCNPTCNKPIIQAKMSVL